MKIHKPVKHAHRRAIIAQKKAKGKYSKPHLPKPKVCIEMNCRNCWSRCPDCGEPYYR